MELKRLTHAQLDLCHSTISSRAFYLIVGDALASGKPLSVVRMADGERALMQSCLAGFPSDPVVAPVDRNKAEWLERMGLNGITNKELQQRLTLAATSCTYFAASLTGIQQDSYNVYGLSPHRDHYVDNFFANVWDEEMKIALFRKAGHVLFVHGNPHTADSMQLRAQANLGVKVSYLQLTNWKQAGAIIERAGHNNAPLVLFSAGPASKYIGPEICRTGKIAKVALDLGQAADHWTLTSLPANREAAEKFHREWAASKATP